MTSPSVQERTVIVRLSGGLGNQLFQYAAGRAIASKYGTRLYLDASDFERGVTGRPLVVDKFNIVVDGIFDVGSKRTSDYSIDIHRAFDRSTGSVFFDCISCNLIREYSFDFDPIQMKGDHIYIDGYRQSWRYFFPIADQIRMLRIDSSYLNGSFDDFDGSIAVHVRRGDYTSKHNLEFHGTCGPEYYIAAVDRIKRSTGELGVHVFTDDPDFCRNQFAHLGWEVVSDQVDQIGLVDFERMRRCKHHVISNSSYSWWAAYTASGDGITVYPFPWFSYTPNTPDICPENWVGLNRQSGLSAKEDASLVHNATVSVIIPTHVRAHYVGQAIESALAQTHKPLEIILSLNGASDDVRDVCRKYVKTHDCVRIVEIERSSLSAARNNGIVSAKGEWIAFLDDDDRWLPEKIEKQLYSAVRMSAEVVSCDFDKFDDTGAVWPGGISRRPDNCTWAECLALDNFFSGGSAAIVRRDCFGPGMMFDEQMRSAEDLDMWRRLSLQYKLFLVPERLVLYREHRNRMTRDPDLMLSGMIFHTAKVFNERSKYPDHIVQERLRRTAQDITNRSGLKNSFKWKLPRWKPTVNIRLSLPRTIRRVAQNARRAFLKHVVYRF